MTEEPKEPDLWENAEDEVLSMTVKTVFRDSVKVAIGLLFGVAVFLARWVFGVLSLFAVGATVSSGVVVACMTITLMKLVRGGVEFKKTIPGAIDKKVRETTAAARRGEDVQENGFQKPPTRKRIIKDAAWRIPSWIMVGAALLAWMPLWGSTLIAAVGYAAMTVFGHYYGNLSRNVLNMQSMMNAQGDQGKDTWEI